MKDNYIRSCNMLKTVDADTFDVMIDLGFSTFVKQRVRLHGVNAPEANTERGKVAMLKTAVFIGSVGLNGWSIQTFKLKNGSPMREKYGRYVGILWVPDGSVSLNDWLVENDCASRVEWR